MSIVISANFNNMQFLHANISANINFFANPIFDFYISHNLERFTEQNMKIIISLPKFTVR